jgi:hypothetical protein
VLEGQVVRQRAVEVFARRFKAVERDVRRRERQREVYDASSKRGDGKIKPQTINRELSEIKSCLSSAKLYFPSLSEYRSPAAPWQEEPTDGRRQTWSDEMVEAVLRELRQPARRQEKPENVASRLVVADMFEVPYRPACAPAKSGVCEKVI